MPFKETKLEDVLARYGHLRPRSDMEDAFAYTMGYVFGCDLARGHDKSVAHKIMLLEHAQRRGRTAAMLLVDHNTNWIRESFMAPGNNTRGISPYLLFLDECAPFPNPTERPTMQDQAPTKQFVTHDVPGFEDGHPLQIIPSSLGAPTLHVQRRTEEGIEVRASFLLTPEAFAAHVRVKAVKPPKVEKKA